MALAVTAVPPDLCSLQGCCLVPGQTFLLPECLNEARWALMPA